MNTFIMQESKAFPIFCTNNTISKVFQDLQLKKTKLHYNCNHQDQIRSSSERNVFSGAKADFDC